MKVRQQNTPTVQYCVEARMPRTGEVVDRFTIEQVEAGSRAGCVDRPNYNTVQCHLNDLGKKTGLNYQIVRWGGVFDRSDWIRGGIFND